MFNQKLKLPMLPKFQDYQEYLVYSLGLKQKLRLS